MKRLAHALRLAALAIGLASPALAQQAADTTYDVSVARPGYEHGRGPRLLIDQAHHNFHTASGRYRPFADLARNDGFRVVANVVPFTASSLVGQNVLVISNALGDDDMASNRAMRAAFTPAEIEAVRNWVEGGGGLLLIADHAPMGAAASKLAAAFGVEMRSAYTIDTAQVARGGNPGVIAFTAAYGLDTTHAIARGRYPDERVNVVTTFTGQSLAGPHGSAPLLALPRSALDVMVTFGRWQKGGPFPDDVKKPAAGRSQGLAFGYGRGRVVVLGEAAMLSAQVAGPQGAMKMGMNVPGNDNRQFALNTLHWLTKLLP